MPTNNPAEIPMPNTDWDTMENDVLVSAYAVAILNTNAEYADAILDVILRRLTRADGLEGRVISDIRERVDLWYVDTDKELMMRQDDIEGCIRATFAAVREEGEL